MKPKKSIQDRKNERNSRWLCHLRFNESLMHMVCIKTFTIVDGIVISDFVPFCFDFYATNILNTIRFQHIGSKTNKKFMYKSSYLVVN